MDCERCGSASDKLYNVSEENDFGDIVSMNICWSCDHDVMNGGSLFDDAAEILMDREENNYAFDPINTPKPVWMQ